ncbi:holo-ACP synthase [Methylocella silvestris]|uniref:Holo-[acyl-carrier-protein] synthase n=1 Tax=Methylocella silvestris TaxID=199596 RepID=A0A2J7TJC3_METSI|nr:holo-ACP synthase [Methylocella silvestris]PNG26856.1 holo-ACP synthase [Methylocella silvestris]
MIIGFGVDICDIRRIEDSLTRFGERFTKRCFTEIERAKSDGRAGRAASYAKRFAAKEACSKALGTGLRFGVAWREMGVVNLPSGKPTFSLTGGALRRLKSMTPLGCRPVLHLSITDEYPWAQAQVIIEALEDPDALLQPPDVFEA